MQRFKVVVHEVFNSSCNCHAFNGKGVNSKLACKKRAACPEGQRVFHNAYLFLCGFAFLAISILYSGRGEATEKSYIDVVVILDELSASDIRAYNDMLDTLDYSELVCFVSVRFFNYVRPKKLKKEIGHKRLTPNIVYDIIIQK